MWVMIRSAFLYVLHNINKDFKVTYPFRSTVCQATQECIDHMHGWECLSESSALRKIICWTSKRATTYCRQYKNSVGNFWDSSLPAHCRQWRLAIVCQIHHSSLPWGHEVKNTIEVSLISRIVAIYQSLQLACYMTNHLPGKKNTFNWMTKNESAAIQSLQVF